MRGREGQSQECVLAFLRLPSHQAVQGVEADDLIHGVVDLGKRLTPTQLIIQLLVPRWGTKRKT